MGNFTKSCSQVAKPLSHNAGFRKGAGIAVNSLRNRYCGFMMLLFLCIGGNSFAQTTTLAGAGVPTSNLSPSIVNLSSPAVSTSIDNFSLVQSGSGANLTQVNFTTTGSYSTTDITAFTLYVNTNANSIIGSSAVTSATVSAATAGLQTINLSTPYSLSTGVATYYFFIVPTVGSGAVTAHTIAISSVPSTNITVSTGSVSGSAPATGTITIINPTITGSTPASRCGTGTVTLSATSSAGSTIDWYSAITGGASLATSSSYTTPSISAPTTYYTEASQAATFRTGTVSDNTTNLGSFGLSIRTDMQWFSTTKAITINSIDIYPASTGTAQIVLCDGTGGTAGTPLQSSAVITITSGMVSNTVPVTIPLGFTVAAGVTNYTLGGASASSGNATASIYRGAAASGAYGPYPAAVTGFSQTGDAASGAGASGLGTRAYLYNWNITENAAQSPRTSVVATVNAVPTGVTATASPNPVCAGSTLTLTGAATGASTFSWTGPGGTAISSPTSLSTSVAGAVAGNAGVYTLTATSAAGCAVTVTSASVAVAAAPVPTFTASPTANSCPSVNVTYTTQAGQSNYTWTVPGTAGTDYTITSGGIGTGSNTVTLQWLTLGSKTVTVNYTTGSCTGLVAASNTTTVLAPPNVTGLSVPSNTATCTGSGSTLTVNAASLSNGTYTVTYSISGANTAVGNTASMVFASGTGTFNTSTLASAGSTTVTITSIANASGCVSPVVSGGARTFTVLTGPAAITGTTNNCVGTTTTLADATGGGVWSSSLPSIATVGSATGVVSALTTGTTTISYTIGSGCAATVSFIVTSPATTFTITGGGSYCAGGTGVLVGLNGSTTGVTYTLFNGATPISPTVAGTNSPISFGLQIASGTYTIGANVGLACGATMLGSVVVSVNPLPTQFAMTGGGLYCFGDVGATVGLASSTIGVNYQLYANGTPVGGPAVGTSGPLSFGAQPVIGTYSIIATNATTLCGNSMSTTVTVNTNPRPTQFSVTGTGSMCFGGSGIPVGLSNSAIGTNYQLLMTGGIPVSTLAGTGGALNFGNQTTASTYTVLATTPATGCSATMSGSAVITVNPLPTVFTINGGGSFCLGGAGVPVGLGSSQTGVNYQLFNGATPVGAPVAGTGVSITFGNQTTVGSYTVLATNATTACTNNMFGSVSVTNAPLPSIFNITGGGNYCVGGTGVLVGLGGSVAGTNYSLYNGTSLVGGQSGTGLPVSFGLQLAAGTYSVVAVTTAIPSCTANMSGTVTVSINPNPVVNTVSVVGTGSYCAGGTGVAVNISNSQTGVNYQLYRGATLDTTILGTGASFNFNNRLNAGSYTVVAVNATTGCSSNQTGSALIAVNPQPTVYAITGGGFYCAGTSGVNIGLSASNIGINYTLYSPIGQVGLMVPGTGSPITFGTISATSSMDSVIATNATTGCSIKMSGNVIVSVNALPTAGTVSGTASYCFGGAGVPINLSLSQVGVKYQLYKGTSLIDTPKSGTGSALIYNNVTGAGTYTISAVNTATGCTNNMLGSATITITPLPAVVAMTGGGPYCSGSGGVHVGLGASALGVSYQLYNLGIAVPGTFTGTGLPFDFGSITIPGTYTVVATSGGCTSNMSGTATVSVNALPRAFTITQTGASYCAGTPGLHIGLDSSAAGISYQLYNGVTPVGAPLAGTTSALDFGVQVAGSYTVVASNNTTGCLKTMTGTATITTNGLPPVHNVINGGGYCPGAGGAPVSLDGSDASVSYQLYNGLTMVGGPVTTGTPGSPITFGLQPVTGIYTVIGTYTGTTCVQNMAGSATVSLYPLPIVYNITGGGNFCIGGLGVNVGLTGSNTGISYQLMASGSLAGTAVIGGGLPINFGLQTITGPYTVVATSIATTCSSTMNGTATVSTNALPADHTVTGGGDYCAGSTGMHVGLNGSNVGTNYQLVIGGSTPVGTLVAGTGLALDFGLQTAAGTYTVLATSTSTTCNATMTGSAIIGINTLPTSSFAVTGGGAYCTGGTGTTITLGGSDNSATYRLVLGTTPTGGSITGTGTSISFTSVMTAGTYSVMATNLANTCTAIMTGTVNVSVNPLPNTYIVSGGGNYCAGAAGVHIMLSGSNSGINYQLKMGGVLTGTAMAGTGLGLDFGLTTIAGAYSIQATNAATGCINLMTSTVNVGINPLPLIHTVVSTSSSYCAGGLGVRVYLDSSNTGINYQLFNGSGAVGFVHPGSGDSLVFGYISFPGAYTIRGTNATTGCATDMAPGVTVAIDPLPTVFAVTGGGAYCAGLTGVHIGLSGSSAGAKYKLYKTGILIDSMAGTGSGLDFGLHTAAGTYTIAAFNNTTFCTNNMSGSAVVTIKALPAANTITGGGPYCAGGAGAIINLSSTELSVSYQLMVGTALAGTPILGTGAAIAFGPETTAGTYSIVGTSSITGCSNNMAGGAVVTINAAPFAYSITGGGNFCPGGTGVNVGVSGSNTGVNYQLYKDGVALGLPMAGLTGTAINFGLQTAAGAYTVVATNGAGCTTAISGTATVIINALPTAYSVVGGGNFCAGGSGVSVGLSNSASGINYTLYRGISSVTTLAGTGGPLNFGLQTLAGAYKVLGTSATTSCTNYMTDSAMVVVNTTVMPSVTLASGAGDTVCSGTFTTFSVTTVGGGTAPAYQWSVSGIPVASGSSYSYIPLNGDIVTVMLTSSELCAVPATASSTKIMIVQTKETPFVTVSANPGTEVCLGTNVTFSATPSFGGTAPSYLWYKGVFNTGVTSSTYSYTPADGDVVFCVMTSNYHCRLANTATSTHITMKVDLALVPVVVITAAPGSIIAAGQAVTLNTTVANGGPAPTYQWLLNGVAIGGATNASYGSSSFADMDSVTCEVMSSGGCAGLSGFNSITMHVANVGVKPVSLAGSNITLVPNPNKGIFTLKGSLGTASDEEVSVEAVNMLGQVVYSAKMIARNGELNERIQLTSSLANGMYILNVRSGTENKTFHFVIEQ
jgi:hypothetical protein